VEIEALQAYGQISPVASWFIESRQSFVGAARGAGSGQQRVDEDVRRGGSGGLPTPRGRIQTDAIYDETGAIALIDPATRRIQAGLAMPNGTASDVAERGANKGDAAIDVGSVVVAGSLDFSRPYTGKHLDNLPDGSAFLRTPMLTALQVENGNFEASSTLVNGAPPGFTLSGATVVSYETATQYAGTRSLKFITTGTFGGIRSARRWQVRPGDVYKLSAAVKGDGVTNTCAQLSIFTGAGVFLGSAQVVTSGLAWVLASSSVTIMAGASYATLSCQNNGAAGGTSWFDDVTVVRVTSIDDEISDGTVYRKPTLNEATGGGRGFTGLDATSKLQTGVTSGATAADGVAGIESGKGARLKSARNAGHVGGQVTTDDARGGTGGVPTRGARVHAEPIYDATGATPLIDPTTKQILPGLAIGSGVRGAADVAFGTVVKFAPNRHNEGVTGVHGAAGVFATDFENIPETRVIPQKYIAPTGGNRVEFLATGVSVSGFTIRAIQTSGSTLSAKTENFSPTLNGTRQATNVLTANGAVCYCDLSLANSTLTTYNVVYDVDTTGMDLTVLLTVKVYRNAGSSGSPETTWTLVGNQSYDTGLVQAGQVISFDAALGVDYDVRVVLFYVHTPSTPGTCTVRRVDFNAVTAGSETSIADATSSILVQAVEKS
jgi:hypothetical protein